MYKDITASAAASSAPATTVVASSLDAAINSSETCRAWVKLSAIDTARGKGGNSVGAFLKQTKAAAAAAAKQQSLSTSSHHSNSSSHSLSLSRSQVVGVSTPVPPSRWPRPRSNTAPNERESSHHSSSSGAAAAFFNSSCTSTTATLSIASDSESTSTSSHLSAGRRAAWGWKRAVILEQSKAAVVVRLLEDDDEGGDAVKVVDGFMLNNSTSTSGNPNGSSTNSNSREVRLPSSALSDGTVLLSNDYATDPDTGLLVAPDDLITLTHLHEPAVVESLQARYAADQIYTNTGAVLLALNPFHNVRGLYGETVMKRYWERAEAAAVGAPSSSKSNNTGGKGGDSSSNAPLPPHVYAIADSAFRSMMRKLEDLQVSSHENSFQNKEDVSAFGAGASSSLSAATQSILVSGESGAGKTVTTKFVMKYLAALSQRSVARQEEQATRAYVKAAAAKKQQQQQQSQPGGSVVLHKTHHGISPRQPRTFQQPSWSVAKPSAIAASNAGSSAGSGGANRWLSSQGPASNNKPFSSSTNGNELASLTLLTSSSNSTIEAQVLQSNPILESFGNARTVRNDNSSRFGKFIEIQFTSGGQLVGANIETYLLEKVRLVHQSSGERNYHIFYELLSGGMEARELSQYFIAKTAAPEDFKLTASGTYDRRDGVSDRETYRALRTACTAMKFASQEMHSIFSVTAALLHASNLTLVGSSETSSLDQSNVHLTPLCHLLGVDCAQLNKALCEHTIQAGRECAVQRSVSLEKAEKGLEALLKATYGALFTYLVKRINDSIAYKKSKLSRPTSDGNTASSEGDNVSHQEGNGESESPKRATAPPAASIGVLDIFGFESFTTNSFEQLCINYCNEALQQQFNAFVLKNEQAEYEREGIEWSFIEFPENQDVLDLIEKRGTGILSILDDQCRAPGPSDKAFCLDVYNKCGGSGANKNARFSCTSKQHANLQFSVQHYAGPVEYTTSGFTEKNRDELSKEGTELLRNSSNAFVQELARIIEQSHEVPIDTATSSSVATVSRQFHRADSSVGRATVGGQFRRQLKNLRVKIDCTSPHYVRCLKPNDHLVPDQFDTSTVAEQLRCGGILEAVRVARAGFTQHYAHADFVRRYRSLAWRELAGRGTSTVPPVSPGGGNVNNMAPGSGYRRATIGSSSPSRTTASSSRTTKTFRNSYLPPPPTSNTSNTAATGSNGKPLSPRSQMTAAEAKSNCKDLLRVLYRKIQQQQKEDDYGDESTDGASSETADLTASPKTSSSPYSTPYHSSPTGTKRSWSSRSNSKPVHSYLPPMPSTNSHGGSVKSRYTPRSGMGSGSSFHKPPSYHTPKQDTASWKRGGLSTSDYAKIGIQMGKTKVFLRHKAFETLERIRSREQTRAATRLNSFFRMYLSRMAYIPYRDAFRMELQERRQRYERDDFKETKEQDDGDDLGFDDSASSYRFRRAIRMHQRNGSGFMTPLMNGASLLVDRGWMDSQIRNAIHNPVPRNEWGKQAPTHGSFKWVLSDGIWVRNYHHQQ